MQAMQGRHRQGATSLTGPAAVRRFAGRAAAQHLGSTFNSAAALLAAKLLFAWLQCACRYPRHCASHALPCSAPSHSKPPVTSPAAHTSRVCQHLHPPPPPPAPPPPPPPPTHTPWRSTLAQWWCSRGSAVEDAPLSRSHKLRSCAASVCRSGPTTWSRLCRPPWRALQAFLVGRPGRRHPLRAVAAAVSWAWRHHRGVSRPGGARRGAAARPAANPSDDHSCHSLASCWRAETVVACKSSLAPGPPPRPTPPYVVGGMPAPPRPTPTPTQPQPTNPAPGTRTSTGGGAAAALAGSRCRCSTRTRGLRRTATATGEAATPDGPARSLSCSGRRLPHRGWHHQLHISSMPNIPVLHLAAP